ncbi:MAG TPA: right-handed parallel beta-helix repeat-containing protein [Chthoniobacterales bacterium]
MSQYPLAFMSYVRFDDQHENGRLTQFCERLSGEVRMQTGEKFHIFQDRNDIAWGQQWKQRIDESLDTITFLIPMITPGFFKSSACRGELERFLQREKNLGRGDLILPVYYVECSILSDEAKRERDLLAKTIAARQFADWRELRFEPFASPEVGKTLAGMARQIVEALDRSRPAPSQTVPAKPAAVPDSAGSQTETRAIEPRGEPSAIAAQPVHGPTRKTEPPTRVVDALHRGDHTTLTEAIKAAKAGDRILIRPGLYKEGVVIDKPVEIVGDGEPGEVVIEASGNDVVLFQATMGRITNLTLRQAGEGDWSCVDIAQGRLDLEECDITSQSLSCVAIQGGADPRLRRNRIHDGKGVGVFVYENGQGTLEDNDIFANALMGVGIATGGNPTLRRNRIHDGKDVGVLVYENGQGTLEDNDIFANANSGVQIKTGGNPTLRRNRISKNGYKAVLVYEGGAGVLEDNDLRGNEGGALDIATDCKGKVTRARNQES